MNAHTKLELWERIQELYQKALADAPKEKKPQVRKWLYETTTKVVCTEFLNERHRLN